MSLAMCLSHEASLRLVPLRCVLVLAALLALSDLVPRASAQHEIAEDDDPPPTETTTIAPPQPPKLEKIESKVESKAEKPPQAQKQQSAPANVKPRKLILKEPDNHYLEMVAGAILFVYVATAIYGKTVNSGIAKAFEKECLEVYEQNFHQVGEKEDQYFVQEGFSNYRLYATGRAHCSFCFTSLDLAKRQDACSTYILSNIGMMTWEDTVRLEIPIDTVDNFSFIIYRKAFNKGLKTDDLSAYGRVRKADDSQFPGVNKDFVVMTDCGEIVGTVLSQSVLQTIKKYEKCVKKIRISDTNLGSNVVKKGIIAEFRLPAKTSDFEKMTNLVRMTMQLVDCVAQYRMSEKARKAIQESRAEAQKTSAADQRIQNEQRMQQKKIEKQKAAEKDWENLTPEQQRKKEEQAYKKQLKNRMPKMKMLK